MNDSKNGPEIDSTLCLLNPILRAFSEIEEMAVKISMEKRLGPPKAASRPAPARKARGKTWAERLAPVREAMESLDRVLDEQKIPRGPLHCGFCNRPIDEGTILTFHGACYGERFEPMVDLRPIKEQLSRDLTSGHPARELASVLPDRISRVESPELFVAMVNLIRKPDG